MIRIRLSGMAVLTLGLLTIIEIGPSWAAMSELNSRPERYAALECQRDGFFVLVNFYPGQVYKLTWGDDDTIIVADEAVRHGLQGAHEIFVGNGLRLALPVANGIDSTVARVGSFTASRPADTAMRTLRCLLHGAD